MSFIAQDFEKLDIITVLEGRTQAVIRDHFLKYDRAVTITFYHKITRH
ncbi:transposase [Streptococcus pneumoniae]|nr:transposase [Streptococcus pneumoniae]